MSEELITSEENKSSEELNRKQEAKKKNVKKIEIIEQYQYEPEENVQLIVDKPSEPLIKKDEIEIIIKSPSELNKKDSNIMKSEKQAIVKSNKELYEFYIKELRNFSLSINGDTIYDSSIDKSKDLPIKFENDYFILYGKKYSYNGLKIQKINVK